MRWRSSFTHSFAEMHLTVVALEECVPLTRDALAAGVVVGCARVVFAGSVSSTFRRCGSICANGAGCAATVAGRCIACNCRARERTGKNGAGDDKVCEFHANLLMAPVAGGRNQRSGIKHFACRHAISNDPGAGPRRAAGNGRLGVTRPELTSIGGKLRRAIRTRQVGLIPHPPNQKASEQKGGDDQLGQCIVAQQMRPRLHETPSIR